MGVNLTMSNNNNLPDSPESRNEQYLQFIATGGKGELPETPESRIEQYLNFICKNASGIKSRVETQKVEDYEFETTVVEGRKSPYVKVNKVYDIDKNKEVRVVYDGEEYFCNPFFWYWAEPDLPTAEQNPKYHHCIGNIGLLLQNPSDFGGDVRSDLPFLITYDREDDAKFEFYTTEAGEHTISIFEITKEYVLIPEELIFGTVHSPIRYIKNPNSKFVSVDLCGPNTFLDKQCNLAVGYGSKISSNYCISLGAGNVITSQNGHAFGTLSEVHGLQGMTVNNKCIAKGNSSFAGGSSSVTGPDAVAGLAFGFECEANAHTAIAIGNLNKMNNASACAVGRENVSEGMATFASGLRNNQTGNFSHIGCRENSSSGRSSVCFGEKCVCGGDYAVCMGYYAKTSQNCQVAFGTYNDNKSTNIFEIGNGTAEDARSNAAAIDTGANLRLKGGIYVGCNADSTGGVKLPAIPECPTTTDGTFTLKCTVTNGVPTYSWSA